MQDEELGKKIEELQTVCAFDAKHIAHILDAWRRFLSWASSFDVKATPGQAGADIKLTNEQSSEFAIGYYPNLYPETLVVFAQDSHFKWLENIGLQCFLIEEDGITFFIKTLDKCDCYIAGKSIKITTSVTIKNKLSAATNNCKFVQLARISGKYDNVADSLKWKIIQLGQETYPVIKSTLEIPTLNDREKAYD